jgi:hypothetical protein
VVGLCSGATGVARLERGSLRAWWVGLRSGATGVARLQNRSRPCGRVGLRSGATGVARLENRSCARGGRVALPRDRHCMYTEHEQAQNRPTLRVSRAAGHISESKLAETCNAGCAGAQPYQTGGERVSEVRFADTPKRQHAQTPTRRYVSACEAPALSAIYR